MMDISWCLKRGFRLKSSLKKVYNISYSYNNLQISVVGSEENENNSAVETLKVKILALVRIEYDVIL